MPPPRKKAASAPTTTITVKSKIFETEEPVYKSFLDYQKETNESISTCDVNLVVSNGDIVPVHAFILQSVSEFFEEVLSSHKEAFYAAAPRLVLLPDFSATEVIKLIEFIYTGSVNFANEKEVDSFKTLMRAFGISDEDTKLDKPRIQKPQPPVGRPGPKSGRGNHPTPQEPPTTPLKIENKPKIYVMKKRSTKSEPAHGIPNHGRGQKRPIAPTDSDEPESDGDLENDPEDRDKKVQDKGWYYSELRKCQVCSTAYANPVDASTCITNHGKYRCYFCFSVEKSTESLYSHYEKKHRKAPARPGYIICAFCEAPTANRSVSSHVISVHLNDPKFKNPAPSSSTGTGPKPPNAPFSTVRTGTSAPKTATIISTTTVTRPGPGRPAASTSKKTIETKKGSANGDNDDEESDSDDDTRPLQVPDLFTVIKKTGILGILRTYTCKDDRSAGSGVQPVNGSGSAPAVV